MLISLSTLPSSPSAIDSTSTIVGLIGLKLKIRGKVKARQPYTLMAAISFMRLQEERLNQDSWRTKVTTQLAAQRPSAPPTTSRPS
ncbi:hypothetical protein GW17_00045822 [Ensete ventricosum]|nr:hypothetical protein GW17_00045822 [Ensete ventricosum]